MTNIEYRRSRGTDHPFTATKKQAKKAWYAIKARKKDQKRKSKKWTQLDYMNTDLYEKDDE